MSYPGDHLPNPTNEDVEDLIAETYSDDRPPSYPMSDEAEWIFHTINRNCSLVGAETIANFWFDTGWGAPPWEARFADWQEDKETEEDQSALQYYLYRVEATLPDLRDEVPPPYPENDVYPIYFLGEYAVNGPACDLNQSAGPFRSLDEVLHSLMKEDTPFIVIPSDEIEFDDTWTNEATAYLEQQYNAARPPQRPS